MGDGDPLAVVEVVPSGPRPGLRINCDFTLFVAFGEGWLMPNPFPEIFREVRRAVALLSPFAV